MASTGHWFVPNKVAWDEVKTSARISCDRRNAIELVHAHEAGEKCTTDCMAYHPDNCPCSSCRPLRDA